MYDKFSGLNRTTLFSERAADRRKSFVVQFYCSRGPGEWSVCLSNPVVKTNNAHFPVCSKCRTDKTKQKRSPISRRWRKKQTRRFCRVQRSKIRKNNPISSRTIAGRKITARPNRNHTRNGSAANARVYTGPGENVRVHCRANTRRLYGNAFEKSLYLDRRFFSKDFANAFV